MLSNGDKLEDHPFFKLKIILFTFIICFEDVFPIKFRTSPSPTINLEKYMYDEVVSNVEGSNRRPNHLLNYNLRKTNES